MSTSISLTISVDGEREEVVENREVKREYKSFCDLHKASCATACACNRRFLAAPTARHGSDTATRAMAAGAPSQPYGRRHTGHEEGTRDVLDYAHFSSGKLKRWRHHLSESNLNLMSDEQEEDERTKYKSRDFYEQVDERMSRNSLEYPEHQAKYTTEAVDRWLRQAPTGSSRSRSFEQREVSGNVIGIRGFSSESLLQESRERHHQRLKMDHKKLQLAHERLHKRVHDSDQIVRQREHDVGVLEALVARQAKRLDQLAASGHCDGCARRRKSADDEATTLKRAYDMQIEQVGQRYEMELARLRDGNQLLCEQLARGQAEMEALSSRVRHLSLEPENRKYQTLWHEHQELRGEHERNLSEYRKLEVNFQQLEARLGALIEDKQEVGDSDERRKLMTELCRLQVYQPKLELTLETERQISRELTGQLERFKRDNERLNERANELSEQLERSRLSQEAHQSSLGDKHKRELEVCQSKVDRLSEEKSSLEELVRSSRSRTNQMDARLRAEIDQAKEACRQELDRAESRTSRLEGEKLELARRLELSTRRLAETELEREMVQSELLALQRKLELTSASDGAHEQQLEGLRVELARVEGERAELKQQLATSETRSRELSDELKQIREQLTLSQGQLVELKRRFEQQQRTFDESSKRKERELSKLRADLNFEAYSRQVALRAIEKELRSSLKELEVMKCRFSRTHSSQRSSSSINKCVDLVEPKAPLPSSSSKAPASNCPVEQLNNSNNNNNNNTSTSSLSLSPL